MIVHVLVVLCLISHSHSLHSGPLKIVAVLPLVQHVDECEVYGVTLVGSLVYEIPLGVVALQSVALSTGSELQLIGSWF